MKKTVVALALMGVFAGVAQAQTSVIIYGRLDAGLVKRSDQTLNIGKRDNNTLGFKGTEDLGSGLKALFQLEMRYEPDTGTIESGAGGAQRPLFQGQSRVGLSGDFGTIRIGRGLTALQETSTWFEPFHGIPSYNGFMTDLQVAGHNSSPLDPVGNSTNRFSNAIFYNTPEVGGFQANVTIGTRESNQGAAIIGRGTAAAPQYAAGAMASSNPFSFSSTYRSGGAAVMVGYERNAIEHKLLSIAGSIMATPELKVMLSLQRHDQSNTKAVNPNTNAWVLGANYAVGASGKILAGYGQKHPEGITKTKQMSVGYEHSMSKRTYMYFDLANKKGGTQVPSSVNYYSIGMNHSF
jgi:predicted porin